MEYISLKEAALKWAISERTVQNYCTNSKIPGAKRIGKQWVIPVSAEKPVDGRRKAARSQSMTGAYHFPLFIHSPYYSLYSELDTEEKCLFDAELLYLQGDYINCIAKCRQLQKTAVNPNIVFGSYLVTGYAALVVGSYTEYRASVNSMERMIRHETFHKEDYRLLLAGLILHVTKITEPVLKIDSAGLSAEALCYYQYLLMLISVIQFIPVDEASIRFYCAYLRLLELEGNDPTALCVNIMLSILYERRGDESSSKQHMQRACGIFDKNNWFSLLVKYYVAEPELISEYLSQYTENYKDKLDQLRNNIVRKWAIIHKLSCNIPPVPELTIEQNEILLLLSENVSRESIASVKALPPEKIDEIISELRDYL